MTCDMGETLSNALRMHRRALRKMQKDKKRLKEEADDLEQRLRLNRAARAGIYEDMRLKRAHIKDLESAVAKRERAETCKTTNSVPVS
jgi:hypothetical protein